MSILKVAFYGDDFTGATDNAAQYSRHGLKSVLFFSTPDEAALHDAAMHHHVVGVAGTARSLPVTAMSDEISPVLDGFKRLGARLIQYKCCSTFDSSPAVGSLGEAIRLMRDRWPQHFVSVLAAMPEFGRYTVFGQHFAVFSGKVYRLDRHPTMSRHPVTPMSEADLARILTSQGFGVERGVDIHELDRHRGTPGELAVHLGSETHAAVFDALDETQLTTAAATIWQLAEQRGVIAMASQGLGFGIGRHFRQSGMPGLMAPSHTLTATDRLLVLSGSCSPQSAAQIAWAEQAGFLTLPISPEAVLGDSASLDAVEARMLAALNEGRSVVAYTARGPDDPGVADLSARVAKLTGSARVFLPERVGAVCARLARAAIERTGIRRLVVAGGDSSSFAMRHLGAHAFVMHASHFGQNAHVGRLLASDRLIDGIEILLKGGQVGTADLYGVMRDGFRQDADGGQ
jgi:uncharacterized protein YgbK (DUF1537 family)